MPTRGSDTSEGTSQPPARRRSSSKSPSTRRPASRSRKTEAAAEEVVPDVPPVVSGDDFGDGVESEPRPARPAARPVGRRSIGRGEKSSEKAAGRSSERASERRTESVTESDPEPVSERSVSDRVISDRDDSDSYVEKPASAPRQLAFFSSDEIDFGDSDLGDISDTGPEPDGGSGGIRDGGGDDGDRRPRRRRRRRRRGGEGRGGEGRGPVGEGRGPVSEVRGPAPEGRSFEPRSHEPRSHEHRPLEGRSSDSRSSDGRSGPPGIRGISGDTTGRQSQDRSRGRRRSGGGGGGGRPGDDRRRSGGGRDAGVRERGAGAPRRARQIQPAGEVIEGTFDGVLELHPKGYGFLRDPKKNYAAEDSNPFVSSSLVEKYKLREGVLVRGDVGQGTRNQGPRLQEIELIDGFSPDDYAKIRHFDELTPINPFEQIRLETGPRPLTMRVMDLLCPIGKGQRALLVAPPRTGKTMLLQDIANSVSENHPEIHLMVLLIDERPEEVTEMRRLVNGEVISSSLDNDVESHIRISQLIIERGKRLAEEGKDVFILLDSITRMARAFNKWSNSGRTASGGLDIRALDIPKKLFGTARRFDEGGSLTVCGTALIDTGSRMDEAIFQEFKGTGNMEMVLSRDLADRRIWPSIDVSKSGTRREEKILSPEVLEGTTLLRRSLVSMGPVEAMEQLTRTMEKFPTNREFLQKIRAVL